MQHKNKIVSLAVSTILTCTLSLSSVFAQIPEKMSYQAVIRNSGDQLVTNQSIGMQISILQGSIGGTAVYVERHFPTTNANGLVSLEIGNGNVVSGNFSSIDWSDGPYFIKTETDLNGGANYTISGTNQLLSVPYALHAKTADNITGGLIETDPVYTADPAFNITETDISNWNNAYAWGDHSTAGYLTNYTETDPIFGTSVAIGITSQDTTNWNNKLDIETDPTVPSGTQTGEMQYWNGTAWVTITPGYDGAILTLQNGIPTWTGGAPPSITNPSTGAIWMDKNLGASRVATSSADGDAYGDLYQWGRGTDGHEKRTSGLTGTLSSSDTPGHGNFITNSVSPYDWRSQQNDNLWQGVSGINNPCPSGYRLPTEAEWDAERLSWSSNNSAGAFASPLRISVAGYHFNTDGSLGNVGIGGYYWSGTVNGTMSRSLYIFSGNSGISSQSRALGFSVRCIKD